MGRGDIDHPLERRHRGLRLPGHDLRIPQPLQRHNQIGQIGRLSGRAPCQKIVRQPHRHLGHRHRRRPVALRQHHLDQPVARDRGVEQPELRPRPRLQRPVEQPHGLLDHAARLGQQALAALDVGQGQQAPGQVLLIQDQRRVGLGHRAAQRDRLAIDLLGRHKVPHRGKDIADLLQRHAQLALAQQTRGIHRQDALAHVAALHESGQRRGEIALVLIDLADALQRDRQIRHPVHVRRVQPDKAFVDSPRLFLRHERGPPVAQTGIDVAQLGPDHREIALQLHIAGVRRLQLLAQAHRQKIDRQRRVVVTLVDHHVAQPFIGDGKVLLEEQVVREFLGQLLRDAQRHVIGVARADRIPHRPQRIADVGLGDHHHAQVADQRRVAVQEPLGNLQRLAVRLQRRDRVGQRRLDHPQPVQQRDQAHRQILILGMGRHLGAGEFQPLGDLLFRLAQIALLLQHVAHGVQRGHHLARPAQVEGFGHGQRAGIVRPRHLHAQRRRAVAGDAVKVAKVLQRDDIGQPRVARGHLGLDLGIKLDRAGQVLDRHVIAQRRPGGVGRQHVRAGLRQGARDVVLAQPPARGFVDRLGLVQQGQRGIDKTQLQLLLRLFLQLGHLGVVAGELDQLRLERDIALRRLLQLLAALVGRKRAQVAVDQRAVKRGQRHVVQRRHFLDLGAQIGRQARHRQKQHVAFVLRAVRADEHQLRHAAFDIGQLLAARAVIDILLHQRQRRLQLHPRRAEVAHQRAGEGAVRARTVARRLARGGGKGEKHAVRPPDAPQPRHGRRSVGRVIGQRGRAAVIAAARGPLRERVIPAGVQQHDGDRRHLVQHRLQFRQRQGCLAQPLG